MVSSCFLENTWREMESGDTRFLIPKIRLSLWEEAAERGSARRERGIFIARLDPAIRDAYSEAGHCGRTLFVRQSFAMQTMTDSLVENVNEIAAVAVDDAVIAAYTSEDQFNALTVELLKEVGSFVCVAACILPANTKAWSRNQAIYGGHLVRLFKLISALLDQVCQKRR